MPPRTSAAQEDTAVTATEVRSAYWRTNFGRGPLAQAQEVVEDEHLAVAAGPGADADGGDVHLVGDPGGDHVGDALEDDGEAPGGGQGLGVVHEGLGGGRVAGLDPVAAHGVDRLGGEPEVPHDGDLGVEEGLDHGETGPARPRA